MRNCPASTPSRAAAAWSGAGLRAWLAATCLLALVALPASAAELQVDEGVVVKFGAGAQLVVRDRMTPSPGAVLTSIKDDTVGGQTSAAPQTPALGDWRGLRLEKSAASYGVIAWNDLTIRFSGASDGAGLTVRSLSPTLQNLQVTDSLRGLWLVDGAAPAITGAGLLRNGVGIEVQGGGRPSLGQSFLAGNQQYALLNGTPANSLDARSNWWGDATGPKNATANPGGRGDPVSAGVDFASYVTAAPIINPTLRQASPQTVQIVRQIQVDLSALGATEYRLSEGATATGTFLPLPSGRGQTQFTLSSGDGIKTLTAEYRNAGGASASASVQVPYDVDPPTLTVTRPSEGATVSETIDVEAAASDGSGITRVEFYLDNQLQGTATASPYKLAWNPTPSTEGAHFWRVVAYDSVGRRTEIIRNFVVSHADAGGPALANASFAGTPLANGSVLTRNGPVTVQVNDRSGIARVELLLNGAVNATATEGQAGVYTAQLNIAATPNGNHTLAWRATDSLGNASTLSFSVRVTHAPPEPPVISQPASGLLTRTPALPVAGTAVAGNTVQLLLGGQPAGAALAVGADGRFSGTVTLAQGANTLRATATDAYGTSALSPALTITLDTTVPSAPGTLAGVGMAKGLVRLSWLRSTDSNTVGYDIYRSATNFSDIAAASKLNAAPLAATTYDDTPAADGFWYYRVVAVNASGASSVPSNVAQGLADRVVPRATSIVYAPQGKVDAATGRIGQGAVNLVLTVSEPLQTAPYLAIVPASGSPIGVTLASAGSNTYSGSFVIDANTASGVATASFSAKDSVGNRGTDIDVGVSLKIDTAGPDLTGIALVPASPIKNDPAATLQVTFTFSKAPKAAPEISYLLSGPVRATIPLSGLTAVNPMTWRASFTLPSDAGQAAPETFSFKSRAMDDLDNVSTKVLAANNQFQVYQGKLPPLDVPLGFTAKAQPGGKVRLAWTSVPDAAAYQIYRSAVGQTELLPLTRSSGTDHIDTVPADGRYRYAVASVRLSNGQEAISGQTAAIEVQASANAPGAPQNMTLALTGQGIVIQWRPPQASTVASYNVYRAAGSTITSIQGLTPYKTGITANLTLDANPSGSQSAYVVTALDIAGNESAPSNSAYLNASLLPVTNVRVEQIGNQQPVLSWSPPNGSIFGYLVYVGPDATKVKLTASPIGSLSLTDTGFAAGERRYTIASVDAQGAEMPRSVLLPAVQTQVIAGLPIKRGIMNKLQVQVTNTSASALDGMRVVVRVPINKDGTQFQDHKSAPFSLGGNQTQLVPVIVGGYADMPSTAAAQVGVEIAPVEGELIKIARSQNLDVIDGALVVGLSTDTFTRGATGKLKLTVENTSEVDVELLTATGNGSAESSELRFKLLDNDGNVLVSQSFKQAIGASIVTLPNGMSVARIPAGSSYVSDSFEMNVPGSSPSSARVRLEVDKLRYHTGQPDEITIAGRGSDKSVTLVDTAYTAELTDVSPISSYGDETVTITGRALDRKSGAALPSTRVRLVLNQQGFERSFIVLTDSSGSFSYAFKPTLTDAGLYRVSAVHPDVTDRPEQKNFSINRVIVGPSPFKVDIPRNYPFTIPFMAKSGPGSSATGMRYVLDAASQPTGQLPAGINVQLPGSINLVELQTLSFPVVFSGSNEAQPSGSLVLNVLSNEHGSAPVSQVRVDYKLSEAKPFLVSTPSLIETGLVQGGSQVESVTVKNNGLQDALNLQFTLSKPDGSAAPDWLSIAGRAAGTLAVGEQRAVDISFTPPASVPEGVYEFRLNVQGDNLPKQSLNVYVSLTQSGQGGVLFKASDIYAATLDKQGRIIPGMSGASITLQNEDVASISHELVTDANGEAMVQNLPAGRYKFRAKATNHQELGGRLVIKPGITATQPVFLDYTLITVEWSVREVTVQDRYEITLNATFQTDVPAPVVVLQPASINLPKMRAGEVFYGELTLTNYGLVRADDVKQTLPSSDAYFRYEFLADVPTTLEAKQRVTLPYRVVALKSLGFPTVSIPTAPPGNPTDPTSPSDPSDPADPNNPGGSCYAYSNSSTVCHTYTCANSVIGKACSAVASWFSASNSTCPAPGAGGGSSGGGTSSSGTGPGGGSGWSGWTGWIGSGTGGTSNGPGFGDAAPPQTPIKTPGKKCVFVPNGGKVNC